MAAASGRNPTPAEIAGAKQFHRKALTLDPGLSSAHANLGQLAMIFDWDWATAERELQLASQNGSSAPTEMMYGLLLSYRGQFREADRHAELARSLDPLNPVILGTAASIRYWERRFPEAIALGQQILKRYPDQLNPQEGLDLAYIQSGQADLALKSLGTMVAKFPPIRLFEVMALGRSGRREEGLLLIRQLETEYEQDPHVFRQWFALAWAALGDHVQTVKWLDRSADLHEFQVLNVAVNPAFAEMRNDPGFRALVKRIGL
jgi:tetratricopeptide (TPR) repeat protein